MKILVDMNLSPDWVPLLESKGWDAVHWSDVGAPNAPDTDLLASARAAGQTILTQDLDFSQLLFATKEGGPSVVLLRLADEFDESTRERVCDSMRLAAADLQSGALLTISTIHARLRKLPIIP